MARMIAQLAFRALTTGALLLALTQPAQAETDQRQARILYQKGNAAFKKGDSILARDYYKKSLALHESFDTICNLGRAQAKDKLYLKAYESLAWCAHLYPEDTELAEARIKFIRLRDEVRTEIGPLEQKEVDDRIAEEIERREREERVAEQAIPQEETPPPVHKPSAPETRTVKKRSKAALPVSLTIGGLGLAGLGVGTGFLLKSVAHHDDAEALRSELSEERVDCSSDANERCEELEEIAGKKDTARNISTGSFIAGGVLLVGSVVTYLVWPKTRSVEVAGVTLQDARPVVGWDPKQRSWQLGFKASF